jgi:hypothetical protein
LVPGIPRSLSVAARDHRHGQGCLHRSRFAGDRSPFRLVLAQGRSLIQQRNAIEEHAAELLYNHSDRHLLRSIPGIGDLGQTFARKVVYNRQNLNRRPSVKASLTKSRLQCAFAACGTAIRRQAHRSPQ